jgi:hypothetical protein
MHGDSQLAALKNGMNSRTAGKERVNVVELDLAVRVDDNCSATSVARSRGRYIEVSGTGGSKKIIPTAALRSLPASAHGRSG